MAAIFKPFSRSPVLNICTYLSQTSMLMWPKDLFIAHVPYITLPHLKVQIVPAEFFSSASLGCYITTLHWQPNTKPLGLGTVTFPLKTAENCSALSSPPPCEIQVNLKHNFTFPLHKFEVWGEIVESTVEVVITRLQGSDQQTGNWKSTKFKQGKVPKFHEPIHTFWLNLINLLPTEGPLNLKL